jgi:predicted transcriptional regulator
MEPIKYSPACSRCRQIAGKDPAGVLEDSLCVGHLKEEVNYLRDTIEQQTVEAEAYAFAMGENAMLKEQVERLNAEVEMLKATLEDIANGDIYPIQIAKQALSGGR